MKPSHGRVKNQEGSNELDIYVFQKLQKIASGIEFFQQVHLVTVFCFFFYLLIGYALTVRYYFATSTSQMPPEVIPEFLKAGSSMTVPAETVGKPGTLLCGCAWFNRSDVLC